MQFDFEYFSFKILKNHFEWYQTRTSFLGSQYWKSTFWLLRGCLSRWLWWSISYEPFSQLRMLESWQNKRFQRPRPECLCDFWLVEIATAQWPLDKLLLPGFWKDFSNWTCIWFEFTKVGCHAGTAKIAFIPCGMIHASFTRWPQLTLKC